MWEKGDRRQSTQSRENMALQDPEVEAVKGPL